MSILLAAAACSHVDETPNAEAGGAGGAAGNGRGGTSAGRAAGGASGAAASDSASGGAPQAGRAASTGGFNPGGAGGNGVGAGAAGNGSVSGSGGAAVGGSSGGSAAGGSGGGAAGSGQMPNGGFGGAAVGGASGAMTGGAGGVMTGGTGGAGAGASGMPGVRIVGRTAAGTNGAVRFSWPGVAIQARFSGTQVSMNVNDGNNKNRFTVVVDGGAPKTVTTSSGQSSLALATGLAEGTHELVVWRNTEAAAGVTEFSGLASFGTGSGLLAAPAAPDRRIEVIGDSLSAGAGVEGTSTSCSPNIDAFTNNYLAYGSVAARQVQADVVTIAWSGIGVYRSYSASDPTMPERYDFAIPNDKTAWDFTQFAPHVVVINLGTNDFGSGNPGSAYVDAYVSFVGHVRSKYSGARFVLIDMYGGERATALNQVITALNQAGESKVETLSFSSVPNNNTACNQHPNTAAQQAMGQLLATRLQTLMGW